MTGGVEEPAARRGGGGENERERKEARTRVVERKKRKDKEEAGKGAGRTGSREGEDEEGGGALAEALEGRRSQCTAGECNARQAIRGPTSESTFYRTLRRAVLFFLFPSCSCGYYARIRDSVVSSRCAKLLCAMRQWIRALLSMFTFKFKSSHLFFVRRTVDVHDDAAVCVTFTRKY